jgi:tetratricopeptide (TPR) repeat protein
MIVDNADDMEVWTATLPLMSGVPAKIDQQNAPLPATARLHSFLPDSRNGFILITSRNREVACLLTGSYPQILQVDEMNEVEAMELFTKKSGGGHEPSEVASLVKKLDCIPLAISQTASYIAERGGRITIPTYLTELDGLDQKSLKFLEASTDESHRDEGRSNSVVATWMISFRYIQSTVPSAARLLSIMCLFDRQSIPEDLLTGQYAPERTINVRKLSWWRRHSCFDRREKAPTQIKEKTEVPIDDSNFDRDYTTLNNFALIKTDKNGPHFEMHRLVQLTTKRWLELQNTLPFWTSRYITLMHNNYPWPEESNEAWFICQARFQHAQIARRYRPTDPALLQDWGFLLQNAAAYAHEMGLFQDAENLNRDAVSAWETTFGKGHPNTLRLLSNLGQMLFSLNRLSEAESIHRRILTLREQMHGKENEETLKTVYAIGNILLSQGKLDEAERMYRRVLDGREKRYGITHRDTRLVVAKLMSTLKSQGRDEEAEELLLRAFPSDLNDVR